MFKFLGFAQLMTLSLCLIGRSSDQEGERVGRGPIDASSLYGKSKPTNFCREITHQSIGFLFTTPLAASSFDVAFCTIRKREVVLVRGCNFILHVLYHTFEWRRMPNLK